MSDGALERKNNKLLKHIYNIILLNLVLFILFFIVTLFFAKVQ